MKDEPLLCPIELRREPLLCPIEFRRDPLEITILVLEKAESAIKDAKKTIITNAMIFFVNMIHLHISKKAIPYILYDGDLRMFKQMFEFLYV